MSARLLSHRFPLSLPSAPRLAAFVRKTLLVSLMFSPALSVGQVFVQENNNTVAANSASVSVTYTAAETAGHLNVVVVGWNDTTSSVTSVVDDNANTYALVGTSAGNGESQAIYYAANIGLGANNTPTVTVTFNQSATIPDVRILEYSGLSTTFPLDNWAGNSGVSVFADSGPATTTENDLVLGAGTTSNVFTAAGAGFALRAITTPFSDIVEDSNGVLPAGPNNATASLINGRWVMQVAGFSTVPVTFAQAPVISSVAPIAPTSGPDLGGTSVTITGTNFQPGAVVLFGTAPAGISAVNCTEAGGTTITCLTPAGTAGIQDVTVINTDGKLSSAAAAFTYISVRPSISAVNPTSGPTNGSAISITGTNFEAGARVKVGGLPVGDVMILNATTITANSPGLPVGPADITVTNPDGGTITASGAFTYNLGSGPINYIQHGSVVGPTSAASVSVTMPNLQTAGHLNVVIIGWADTTATVSSVADSESNVYVAAVPVVTGTGLSQIIYYSKNIIGDSATPNQITATFSQAALFPDVRVFEYSGLDANAPLDAVTGAAGTGNLADSGACTTTTPVELILGAATVQNQVTDPGAGFTMLDITHPNGDNAEQQITSVAGSCEATAVVSGGDWVMQAVSFKMTQPAAADFTIASSPLSPATVPAGGSATSTITIASLNGFNSNVSLSCAVTPVGARIPTCSFSSASVAGGTGTSTLTVQTTASTTASFLRRRSTFYAIWLPIGGLALLGTGITSRKKKLLSYALVCLMFPGLVFMAACGGSSSSGGGGTGHPGTPAGTYTVTVTGTSGSVTHMQTVTLAVTN